MPCINLFQKYTKPAIDSIQVAMMRAKSKGIDCRLLLVDNASSDETSREASKLVSALFAHQRNEERWGFQKSVNFGVNDAWERDYDLAFVCNNDILMHPEAIWRLVARFEGVPYTDSKGEKWPIGMVTAHDMRGEVEPDKFSDMNPNEKKDVPDAPHPNFSAFMLSRECWETVGEMDEVFAPAYYEDNDYHHRMELMEIAAIVHPVALFYHFASGTQKEANEDNTPLVSNQQFENNRAEYERKWGGQPTHETFEHPYNNEKNSIRCTKQNLDA